MKYNRESLKQRKEEMIKLRDTMTYQEIGDLYKLSRQRVFRIINGNQAKGKDDYSDLVRVYEEN